jgi:aminomethyltransferase
VPFAGYELPIHYAAGITAEHHAVRAAAGLFDVSHMGEFEARGADALAFVQAVSTNDASKLDVGQAQYSSLTREDGTLLDDLLVYRFPDRYLLVVNAAMRDEDLAWLARHAGRFDVDLTDRSDDIALLALQGPRAQRILGMLTDDDLDSIGYYRFREAAVDGRQTIVSRTGYTGEDGFEIFTSPEDAVPIWRALLHSGAPDGLLPAGLGARDSLRLEVGYALSGSDFDAGCTPLEAGLGWVTKLGKGDFVGRDALAKQKEEGPRRRLVGFRLRERGFPRRGYALASGGEEVGTVTSGTLSPTLGVGIGLGYVRADLAAPGTPLDVVIRDRAIPAEVVRPPFYAEGSIRR